MPLSVSETHSGAHSKHAVLIKMVGALAVETHTIKSVLLMQNRQTTRFYVVRSGELEVLRMIRNPHEFEEAGKLVPKPADVKEREKAWVNVSIADLTVGDLFGHQEAMTGRKALFTVRAKTLVQVWTMSLDGIRSLGKDGSLSSKDGSLVSYGSLLSSRLLDHARSLLAFHKKRFHQVGAVLFGPRSNLVQSQSPHKGTGDAHHSSASLVNMAENKSAIFGASFMTPDTTYEGLQGRDKTRKTANRNLSRLCPKVPQPPSALAEVDLINERGYIPAAVPARRRLPGHPGVDKWTPNELEKEKGGILSWASKKVMLLTEPCWFEHLSYAHPVLHDPNKLNERWVRRTSLGFWV